MYQFCDGDINKFVLLLRRGVLPYEYIDSWEKFNETTLPAKKVFYSQLNLEDITDEDNAHYQKVFKKLGLKNIGDYHDLCVQCDTLLLLDVFENFRDKCIKIYELDPAHFLSAPGLAWQACLKKKEVELELITDYDIFLKQMLSIQKICLVFIKVYNFYPKEKKLGNVEKLVCNMQDKENYVPHIRSLKQALNHGLILKKVHRVIQFNQKAWLKPYINMNTKKRKEAKNEFEKYFFKLMNNAVFGKTMDNLRKHRDIIFVTTDKTRNQLVSEPNYQTRKRFSEDLLPFEMKKIQVKMNKPVYLGMSILGNSKTLMYEFWYDHIKPKYGDRTMLHRYRQFCYLH